MTKTKVSKPKVNANPVADKYSSGSEKIIEISFPDGTGCLICFFAGENENRVDVYNIDNGINVVVGKVNQ